MPRRARRRTASVSLAARGFRSRYAFTTTFCRRAVVVYTLALVPTVTFCVQANIEPDKIHNSPARECLRGLQRGGHSGAAGGSRGSSRQGHSCLRLAHLDHVGWRWPQPHRRRIHESLRRREKKKREFAWAGHTHMIGLGPPPTAMTRADPRHHTRRYGVSIGASGAIVTCVCVALPTPLPSPPSQCQVTS